MLVCQNVRYRVFKRTADTYYIEQTDPSPCDFSFVGTKYLVLVLKDRELQASIWQLTGTTPQVLSMEASARRLAA